MSEACETSKRLAKDLRKMLDIDFDSLEKDKDMLHIIDLHKRVVPKLDNIKSWVESLAFRHYKKWSIGFDGVADGSEAEEWVDDNFHYNWDTLRMEIDILDLRDTSVEYLPKHLTVKGYLSLGSEAIKTLPDDLIVKGNVTVWGQDSELTKEVKRLITKGNIKGVMIVRG